MQLAFFIIYYRNKWGLIIPKIKAAGVACVQLSEQGLCMIFGRPERPACCSGLQASAEMCGENKEQAIQWLSALERATCP
jgi:hypothetical protein